MEPSGGLLVNGVAANADGLLSSQSMTPPPIVLAVPLIGMIRRLTPTTTALNSVAVLAIVGGLRVVLLVPGVVTPRIPHDVESVAFGAALPVLDLNYSGAAIARFLN